MNNDKNKLLTLSNGAPEADDNNSKSTKENPAVTLSDVVLFEKNAHFNRERIPERVVHAKGAAAYGTFTVTNDLTKYTCAKFLSKVGKKTEVLTRFSIVNAEKGAEDTKRDPRGFAVKFYTEEGNYDLVANNTPVFFVRDAIKFPDFIHSQRRNPITNLVDYDAYWDFLSLTPESMFQTLRNLSDYGTPDGYRFMDGFGTHTFIWYNDKKEHFYVKLIFKSNQGIKNLTGKEAREIAANNTDYATEDLFRAIQRKEYPSWTLYVQILTPEQAKNYRYDVLDVTKVIYESDYPLIEVGVMELNRWPRNFFTEVEQSAFCPGNIVPGIALSEDKMLNARAVFYSDAQRHRLGPNFMQLKVNAPISPVAHYQRDGFMQLSEMNEPNYYPNSYNGPKPNIKYSEPQFPSLGPIGRHDRPVTDIDFEQPRNFYEKELSKQEKDNLITNLINHLGHAAKRIQYRQCALFFKTSKDLGTKVSKGLKLDLIKVCELASMSDEERVSATK